MLSRLDDYDLNNNKPGIVYPREWGANSKNANLLRGFGCDAFEEGYWDEFVVYIEKSGIRPEEVATIFEQTLLINSDPNLFSVYEHLKSIENLFVMYSKSKYSKYKFVGNGEGLALAFACMKAGVDESFTRIVRFVNNVSNCSHFSVKQRCESSTVPLADLIQVSIGNVWENINTHQLKIFLS